MTFFATCTLSVTLLIMSGMALGHYNQGIETGCRTCECVCTRWCEVYGSHYISYAGCASCGCMCARWCEASKDYHGDDDREQEKRPSSSPEPDADSAPRKTPRVAPSPAPTRTPRPLPSRSPRAAPSKIPQPSPKHEGNQPSGYPSGTGQCETCSKENFQKVNQYRGQMGAGSLKWNDDLAQKAKAHSKWMFDRDLLEHSTYGGWENIAMRHGSWEGLGEAFFEQWKASSGHNTNMLLESHTCGGVGVYGDGSKYYATQIFMHTC